MYCTCRIVFLCFWDATLCISYTYFSLFFLPPLQLSWTRIKLILLFVNPASHLSPSPAQTFSFTCPPSLTLLSPLVPVVPSQTNGAHYSRSKNSPAASWFIFFPSVALPFPSESSCVFPLFRTSLRREMSNGEKACQLIYQLAARVQLSVLSGWKAVGLWGCGTEPAPPAVSVIVPAIWPWGRGQKVKMNQ